ncbi:glutathione S-transferase family protein [Leptospira wolffii]|uniref:glutathione S-transferase family protein n=1 Tax=Leptospira wolffii TaxID=409998 RepID=UPI0010836B06|nr:glutathione S-transferase family protein [Leptospira wolffii]TGK60133.1 glutathione S-transferase family protein [Leptospira wolffii]TGK72476.1 glutathione S-transferase family protein [Leptospira wolffii]TGK76140.1 glutathione S-transferase family protein [Leptospira wolffii]TGL30392.1 glutathione S-transferase family protein [Leptospira wolffii]
MIKLYGYPISNYTNKVKLALLEKGLEFEDIRTPFSQEEEFLKKSPMGKIPYLEVDGVHLFESQAILEFLDQAYPDTKRLIPSDPLEAALVRSIIVFIENYIDIPARRIYTLLVAGDPVPPETVESVKKSLERGAKALSRIVKFDPYIAGKNFTAADCSAYATFPIVLEHLADWISPNPVEQIPGLKEYLERISATPNAAKVDKPRSVVMKALKRIRK